MPGPRRFFAVLGLSAALVAGGGVPAAAPAQAATAATTTTRTPSPTAQAVELVQRARVAAGRPRLRWASDLGASAQRHAGRMAAQRRIFHNPTVSREICCWRAWGENVGVSRDVQRLHHAFMNSSGHRRNILDARWGEIGVGVVRGSDGRLYEVQVFRARR